MYTAQELAEEFDLSVTTIYRLVQYGVLPHAHGHARTARYGPEAFAALKTYREHIPRPGDRVTRACIAERHQTLSVRS